MELSATAEVALGESEVTVEWVEAFAQQLEATTWKGPEHLKLVLPQKLLCELLERITALCKADPTLVEVNPEEEDATVVVVGDTHGQVHDVLEMLKRAGNPSHRNYYVFNGDFVDRGAWGLEVLLVLGAWKLALPSRVTLLRGNHETTTCTMMYGFRAELERKYGRTGLKPIYAACKRLFAVLPLAARIGSATLVLHGGLYRKPAAAAPASKGKRKRKRPTSLNAPCEVGSLVDLRGCSKGGADPNGRGSTMLATDVLWSDPVAEPGMTLNDGRGVGVVFGPDVTQKFLEENGLKLILRSHEGPDARFERDDMASMAEGWTEDHVTTAGRLLTVFSAPDYPQFQSDEMPRYNNKAAVAVLRAPSWASPDMVQYEAVLPRPAASAFYDFMDVVGSDEEIEILGSDASRATSFAASDTGIEVPGDGEEATFGTHGVDGHQQNGQPEPHPLTSAGADNHAMLQEPAGPSCTQDGSAAAAQVRGDGEAGAAEVMDTQEISVTDEPPVPAQSTISGVGPATDGLDAAAGHLLAITRSPGINLESKGAQPSQGISCDPAEPTGMSLEDSPLKCAQQSAVLVSAPGAQQGEGLGDAGAADDRFDALSSCQEDGNCALNGQSAAKAHGPGHKSGSKAGVAKQSKPWRP